MSHYYELDGSPRYEVPNKAKGGLRPTTISDAKKLNLVPSVTTILQILDKPALNTWKEEQLFLAIAQNPWRNNWEDNFEKYKGMIRAKARKVTEDAAKRGNEIHDALECFYKVAPFEVQYDSYVRAVNETISAEIGRDIEWVAEESFGHASGFGGKCDLHSKTHNIVLDFKTKSTENFQSVKGYDEHCMQLAAYRIGLGIPEAVCYNIFISTHKPGEIKIQRWSEEEVQRGERMFNLALQMWQEKNNYKPKPS